MKPGAGSKSYWISGSLTCRLSLCVWSQIASQLSISVCFHFILLSTLGSPYFFLAVDKEGCLMNLHFHVTEASLDCFVPLCPGHSSHISGTEDLIGPEWVMCSSLVQSTMAGATL